MNETGFPGAAPAAVARARDRLAAVAAVAALLGHKARNRLATLRAALEVLREGWERNLSAEYRAALLQQFEAFLGDFNLGLEMIRCDVGEIEEVALPPLLAGVVAEIRPQAPGVRWVIEDAGAGPPLHTDPRLLRLVLLNLLRNAAQAVDGEAGPRIAVSAVSIPGGRRFEVADNGPGVPAAFRSQLFRTAVTSKEDGTGLGLLLCHDAVTVLGGSISYLTAEGESGAHFRVELPAGAAAGA